MDARQGTSRNHDKDELYRELEKDEYRNLLYGLQKNAPHLQQFQAWPDVLAFMHDAASPNSLKDNILREIFSAHAVDSDSRWRTILLAIFWPGLESIFAKKHTWDENANDLWQNIIWTFLQILSRIDVEKRRDRLFQKVINDTYYHLHEIYSRNWKTENSSTFLSDVGDLIGNEDVDFAAIALHEAQEKEIAHLKVHLDAGRINTANFALLVGTQVYGKTDEEYAAETGLKAHTVKKRRQRAEARIRKFQRAQKYLSPFLAQNPPFIYRG